MATTIDKETLKRIDDVIEQGWNHVTPGTPDFQYVQQFKRNLREAISPTPIEQPATPTSAKTTSKSND